METLQLDYSHAMADQVGVEHGISSREIEESLTRLTKIRLDFAARRKRGELAFIDYVKEPPFLKEVMATAESVRYKFQNVIVLGIGGSGLGTRALSDALLPPLYNSLESKERLGCPRLFVCDNIDPYHFQSLISRMDWRETCVNVVSKSGKTSETAAQLLIVQDVLRKKFGSKKWKDHVIVTTDPATGPLRTMAVCEQLRSFPVPKEIGGRFSVFTPVGLFPAACVGIDVVELLKGAASMVEISESADFYSSPAYLNALIHYLAHTKHGKGVSVMMPYSDSLIRTGEWYAQLWAESLGKGGTGQTVVRAAGATDQHSQLQLMMEGPNDKLTTFLKLERFPSDITIPRSDEPSFDFLAGHTLGHLLNTECDATAKALVSASRPNVTVKVPSLTPFVIGQLLMMYMIQTAVCGELYGINTFDQPGVELGKVLTRELLAKKSS